MCLLPIHSSHAGTEVGKTLQLAVVRRIEKSMTLGVEKSSVTVLIDGETVIDFERDLNRPASLLSERRIP